MPRVDPNARKGVGLGLRKRKVRVRAPEPTRAPVTDLQSSGARNGYGGSQRTARAEQAKHAARKVPAIETATREDIVAHGAPLFREMDRNGDGRVTRREIRPSSSPMVRSEHASERPDADRAVRAYKGSQEYVDLLREVTSYRSGTKSSHKGLLGGFRKRSALDAAHHRDEQAEGLDPANTRGELRTDNQVRGFLKTGILPGRHVVLDPNKDGVITVGEVRAVTPRTQTQQFIDKKVAAPALKAIDQTMRPARGVAAASDALISGKGVGGAVHAGKTAVVTNKGPMFGDVLRKAGAPKGVAAVGGFVLDVAGDPTTYLSGGSSIPAKAAAREAEKKILERAERTAAQSAERVIRAGGSKEKAQAAADEVTRQAQHQATRTARKVYDGDARKNKGLSLTFRAKIPFTDKAVTKSSSGRATSAILRAGPRVAGRKLSASSTATAVRGTGPVQVLGKALVHDFRPAGRDPLTHDTIRRGTRNFIAGNRADAAKASRYGDALRRALPDTATRRRFIDQVEAGGRIDDDLLPIYESVRKTLGQDLRANKTRGLQTGAFQPAGPEDAQRYLPRERSSDVSPDSTVKRMFSSSSTRSSDKIDKRRKLRETTAAVRDRDPKLLSEHFPTVAQRKLTRSASARRQSDLWQTLGSTGRALKHNAHFDADKETIYKLGARGIEKVGKTGKDLSSKEVHAALGTPIPGDATATNGRFVILKDQDVSDVQNLLAPRTVDKDLPSFFRRGTAAWKTFVTQPNPGYHARNAIGDSMLAVTAGTSADAFRKASQVMLARGRRNKFESRQLQPGVKAPKERTVKVAGKSYTHEQLLMEAERRGVIGGGFAGTELREGINAGKAKVRGKIRGTAQKIIDKTQYREDVPRMATFISGLERGQTMDEAAEHAARHHFDYSDLTPTERGLRTPIPFYTFAARNTRLQTSKLLKEPGKVALFGKAREEAAKAAGFESYDDYESNLSDNAQRSLPLPVKVGGKVYSLTYGDPQSDLNSLSTDAQSQFTNVATRLNPFIKDPLELGTNTSFFFGGDIERPNSPLVPAPRWAANLPEAAKKKLGVSKYYDKRRGKFILGWRGKADYLARQTPITNTLVQGGVPGGKRLLKAGGPDLRGIEGQGSRGQTESLSRIGYFSGVKPTPLDWQKEDADIGRLQEEVNRLDEQTSRMRQIDPRSAKTAKMRVLQDKRRLAKLKLDQAKTARGDDINPSNSARVSGFVPPSKEELKELRKMYPGKTSLTVAELQAFRNRKGR